MNSIETLLALSITFLVAWIVRPYLSSYVKKRGENQAVLEDLDKINRQLESIKSEFIGSNAYSAEKAKGLATKEDIGEITRQVESVKSELSLSLEIVKLELSKKATVHRIAAEKEFQALAQIGEALFELQMATQNLRPTMDKYDPDEPPMERHNRRYMAWAKSHDAYLEACERNRLFLPKFLYLQFFEIRRLAHTEAVGFKTALTIGEGNLSFKAYEQGAENISKMLEAIDKAITAIRRRYGIED
jgi:archaellum component FlaC